MSRSRQTGARIGARVALSRLTKPQKFLPTAHTVPAEYRRPLDFATPDCVHQGRPAGTPLSALLHR